MDVVGCAAMLERFFTPKSKRRKALQHTEEPIKSTSIEGTWPKNGLAKVTLSKMERTPELTELIPSPSPSSSLVVLPSDGSSSSATENGPKLKEKGAKIVRFGDQCDIIGDGNDEEEEEMVEEEKKNNEEEKEMAEEEADFGGGQKMQIQSELERAQKSVQFLQFQIQEKDDELKELKEKMEADEQQNGGMVDYEKMMARANAKIEELMEADEAKQKTIEGLEQKLSAALEAAAGRREEGEVEEDGLRMEIVKLEQKLMNANEEKEYYKKHFKGEQNGHGNVQNGKGGGSNYTADDFGKELMLANKRKYQLESRAKQMELELKEAQQGAVHLAESLKSTEKLLWLEKERSSTLEMEREQLGRELGELRLNGDRLKRELEALNGEGGPMPSGEEQREEMDRMRAESEQRVNEMREMKNRVEWRLGELTQLYHDTKWRLGEIDATLAHRDWELEEARDRIKQLEGSLASTNDSAKLSDEVNRLRGELARQGEEKGKVEWRLGEVTQWWNDAKWRLGQLEAETARRSELLDQAHLKIGELQRRMEGNHPSSGWEEEAAHLERKMAELDKTYNDSQWRVGELKADLHRIGGEKERLMRELEELREAKGNMEWRLGEVTQWWNDAKWRIGELEECLRNRGGGGKGEEARNGEARLAELDLANQRLDSLISEDIFLIRKQPHVGRQKWKLLTKENSLKTPLRRVWFETEGGDAKEVFLVASFLNWECALRCEPITGRPSWMGIWVDVPSGRHEFRFLRDGKWHTGEDYGECWNEHGTRNNWIDVPSE